MDNASLSPSSHQKKLTGQKKERRESSSLSEFAFGGVRGEGEVPQRVLLAPLEPGEPGHEPAAELRALLLGPGLCGEDTPRGPAATLELCQGKQRPLSHTSGAL